ncbi:hypothetical protein GUITHDRAFT_165100 [Guillardia theta CCMP2712]|uniref:Uncharacterized protein n=1 Tax=Guillardia theta (strain CCMP2712) TaxID=905079 RepID=L1ISM9_GUITC|nr:hypothetical protein GUITHDRAFT_165100 [Guillardia theta CCMP2712]EKX38904.1 hypothetical protein GUITHDRAFT_165100 [Guillardia theta CCMP2712]|eukprot:XP_005825884.1 hypothetical protein GUITHDRAFT_165100 [Guillardia theta CCMP2712]
MLADKGYDVMDDPDHVEAQPEAHHHDYVRACVRRRWQWVTIATMAGILAILISLAMHFSYLKRHRKSAIEDDLDSDQRRFTFTYFKSCSEMEELTSLETEEDISISMSLVPGWSWWSSDYCDYCNCSTRANYPGLVYAAETAKAGDSASSSSAAGAGAAAPSSPDYSTTNNQVKGVDEADVIKTDGRFFYLLVLSENLLIICKAYPPQELDVLSRVDLRQSGLVYPQNLFIKGDIVAVLGTSTLRAEATGEYFSVAACQLWDIKNRSAPSLTQTIEVEGDHVASRLVDDVMYLAIRTYCPLRRRMSNEKVFQPSTRASAPLFRSTFAAQDSMASPPFRPIAPCTSISWIPELPSATGWISIVSVRISRENLGRISSATHAGNGFVLYASSTHLYVASTTWGEGEEGGGGGGGGGGKGVAVGEGGAAGGSSFRLAEPMTVIIKVPGIIINQFAMDEFDDHLRVATTSGDVWGQTSNMVYVVTFRRVDPLFVINASDPWNPLLKGELKIPGFSEYLHPINDTHLIGLGRETREERGMVLQLGVKISVFDVTVPSSPKEQQAIVLGGAGSYSEAAWDHKAFLLHRGLLVLPMYLYTEDQVPFSGAILFDMFGEKIKERGRISHCSGVTTCNENKRIRRSVYIDDCIFTFSDRTSQVHQVRDVTLIRQVNLSRPACE